MLRLDDDALLADPALRAADPTLESVVNVNEPGRLRDRPGPAGAVGDRRVLRRAGLAGRPRGRAPCRPAPSAVRPARSTSRWTGTSSPPSTATRPAGTPSCRCSPATRSRSSPRTPADDRAPGGYFGRALVVDVTDGSSRVVELPDQLLRDHIGGAGLGVRLLTDLAPRRRRPAGTRGAARVRVLAAGRHAAHHQREVRGRREVAADRHAHRRAGLQPLRHRRQAHRARRDRRRRPRRPAVACCSSTAARSGWSRPTTRSAGRPPTPRPRCASGSASACEVAAIGPAGERGVRYATLSHDGRHAGRGGLGAVLGAKNIKAVAVRAADQGGAGRPGRGGRRRQGPAGPLVRRRHREVPRARHPGEPAGVQRAVDAAHPQLPAPRPSRGRPRWPPRSWPSCAARARNSCASCSIGCEHIYQLSQSRGGATMRVEYENVFALGPMCGVSDADDVLAASARCDELGIDTISAGGTIAWAMECAERGLIDAPWLRFGDGAALLRALDEIGTGTGHRSAARGGLAPRRGAGRAGLRRLRPAGEGPRAARLRAAVPARDGARAGGQRARRRPQPLRRLRGRPRRRPRPARRRSRRTSRPRSRPRTAPRSWTR